MQVSGHGTVQLSTGQQCKDKCVVPVANGARVTATASPDGGWMFSGWSGSCGGSGACQFTADRDLELDAAFALVPTGPNQHALAVALAGNGSGHVVSNPAGIDCGTACSAKFDEGTSVKLSAQPAGGSSFSGWSGACSGTGDCTVAMNADATATATFVAGQPPPPPPADECAGLAPPAPGTPNSFRTNINANHYSCERGVVDGSGNLALWTTHSDSFESQDIFFLDAGGTVKGHAEEDNVVGDAQLTGQISGFEGLVNPQGAHLVVFAADGTVKSSARVDGSRLAEDPTGGVMVAIDSMAQPTLDAYDASGARRWHVQLAHSAAALGVDRAGNALVLSNPGSLHGQWVDHSGNVGPDFDLGVAVASGTIFELYPRIGSGLFVLKRTFDGLPSVFDHTAWAYQLDSLAPAATPAPDWLAARPDTRMHVAHGGTAYAMLPVPAQGDCTQHIEVLAPSGKSCGSAEFRLAAESCPTSFIDVGYDGTVV